MHVCDFACLYSVQACILSLEIRKRELELVLHNGNYDKCRSLNSIDNCCDEINSLLRVSSSNANGTSATKCGLLQQACLRDGASTNWPLCQCEAMQVFGGTSDPKLAVSGCVNKAYFEMLDFKAAMITNKSIMDDLKVASAEAISMGVTVNPALLTVMSLHWTPMGAHSTPSAALSAIVVELQELRTIITGRMQLVEQMLVDINREMARVLVVKSAISRNSDSNNLNRFECASSSAHSSTSSADSYRVTALSCPNDMDECPFRFAKVYSKFSSNHEFSHGLHQLENKLRALKVLEERSSIWNNYEKF